MTVDNLPEVHYGIQGGQHMYLGVELDNPEFDSPGLEIAFTVRGAHDCALDLPAEACEGWTSFGARSLVVTDPALLVASGDHLTTTGYVVLLEDDPDYYGYESPARIEVRAEVHDACDRRGIGTFNYRVTAPGVALTEGSSTGTTSEGSTGGSATGGSSTGEASSGA